MKENVLHAVYQLVDEIKDRSDYKRMIELSKIIDENEEIIKLVDTFNKAKIKYSEVTKYGKHHPDLLDAQKDYSKAKEKLFTNELINEYKELEKKIQKILDGVSREIASNVSAKIKHPNEMGLINKT